MANFFCFLLGWCSFRFAPLIGSYRELRPLFASVNAICVQQRIVRIPCSDTSVHNFTIYEALFCAVRQCIFLDKHSSPMYYRYCAQYKLYEETQFDQALWQHGQPNHSQCRGIRWCIITGEYHWNKKDTLKTWVSVIFSKYSPLRKDVQKPRFHKAWAYCLDGNSDGE